MDMDTDETYRVFGAIDDGSSTSNKKIEPKNEKLIVSNIQENIVGQGMEYITPFGRKKCIYTDWTASGRAVTQIENFVHFQVLPFYGNTHTTTSITGHQSTCFRQESRQIVAEATNAKITGRAATDALIFTGNGTTSAVLKFIHALGIHLPLPENLRDDITYRPVVFTSIYEHHSNLLPWRESNVDVVTVGYHTVTGVCLSDLQHQLNRYSERKLKIGTFSAASNVTGVLTAVNEISILMHKAGGIVAFDYATAAPYVKMDMNPVILGDENQHAFKDAIFFSGHKFLGGLGASGVLVVKKRILTPSYDSPNSPGGGTVFYVSEDHQRYLSNQSEREESGTPNIIGDIKLGLALHLKQSVGSAFIEQEEILMSQDIAQKLSQIKGLHLMGRDSSPQETKLSANYLPIFSFLIQPHGHTRFLHYNFVGALLNDLFGIQSRGGCMCAGPFSQELLGMTASEDKSENYVSSSVAIENALLDKQEVLRPGYTRMSFPYWIPTAEVDYVISAVDFIAKYGVNFIPLYRYNHRTGEWAHNTRLTKFPERLWLSHINFNVSIKSDSENTAEKITSAVDSSYFAEQLALAHIEVATLEKENLRRKRPTGPSNQSDGQELGEHGSLRWFVVSSDAPQSNLETRPIQPKMFQIKYFGFEKSSVLNVSFKNQMQENTDVTRYAHKRSLKLVSHGKRGGATSTPRYVDGIDRILGAVINNTLNSVHAIAMDSKDTNEIHAKTQLKIDDTSILDNEKSSGSKVKMFSAEDVTFPQPLSLETFNAPSTKVLPPKKLMKSVGQAIKDWSMIEEGDKLLLGLSGGKDSLTLLHVLLQLQKKAPISFTIACATVDPQTESFDPSPLIPYLKSLGITYHYLSEPIIELAKSRLQGDSLCAFCARFKRGLLYSCCRTHGYNKLVLAQHLDDLAESFFMSALHNGQVRTMKANYAIDAGDVRVIRPLVYTRETVTRDYSFQAKLPIINENCPACFEQPKERHRVKKLLSQEEAMIPSLFANLRKALLPLMHQETYDAMHRVSSIIESISSNRDHVQETRSKNTKRERATSVNENEQTDSRDTDNKRNRNASALATDIPSNGHENAVTTTMVEPVQFCTDGYCVPCYELL